MTKANLKRGMENYSIEQWHIGKTAEKHSLIRRTKYGYRVIDICAEGITPPGIVENCILKDFETARWLADKYAEIYTGR